ncbi:hypothetical protein [Nonomuraea sp. NPDC050310]|uniref:hypothetical protein n=1 Tax=unclassified Nonomuraea TaxID=2593643 RepID=UPI0034114F04
MRTKIGFGFATLALIGATAACGAVGQAVDCNAVGNEVTQIMTTYSNSLTGAMSKPEEIAATMEKSGQEAAGKLKALAAKHDGDLAAAVNDLAGAMESMKVDAANPTAMTDGMTKMQSFQTKIVSACS